jgi:dolichyl-phosphate-mannose-protein mannosyltransferase
MGRQLFLHHYLPAHVASCLVTGALVEFIFNPDTADEESIYGPKGGPNRHVSARERFAGRSMKGAWIACLAVISIAIAGWYFFLPLTYGYPGLSVEQVKIRKLLGYDLHFAK